MPALLGLDLGTSSFKVTAFRSTGEQLGTVSRPTPWRAGPRGTELIPAQFAETVRGMLDECASRYAGGPVAAIGVTGMAETVFAETAAGERLPARAWNDQQEQQLELPEPALVAKTGLLDAGRSTAVELRRLTAGGTGIRSWSGLPEYAVQLLGGCLVAERSLAARSGLVDVRTESWSPDLLAWAGVEHAERPGLQAAGQRAGEVGVAGPCSGAVLTVAGHDHQVGAVGAGAAGDADVFDSIGTGEALIARIGGSPAGLGPDVVARFNRAGFTVGLGLQQHDAIALAGFGTGNRFGLLLAALADAGFGREQVLSVRASATRLLHPEAIAMLTILFGPGWQRLRRSGAATEIVKQTVPDMDTARALWWTGVEYASRNVRTALDALGTLTPRATRLVAAGGWLNNAGIRALREQILGPFDVPATGQCGTRGAALLAGLAAGVYASRADFPTTTAGVTR